MLNTSHARQWMVRSRWLASAALLVGLLALALAPAPASAESSKNRANDCNGDIQIDNGMVAGAVVPVTLTVENGPSTDAMNAPVGQLFPTVSYYPNCSSTAGGCTPAAGAEVDDATFATDCPGTVLPGVVVTDGAGERVDFTGTMLAAAGSATGTTSCQITFDVNLTGGAGNYVSLASTDGACDGTGLFSSSLGTSFLAFAPVPTVGEIGLAALALLLLIIGSLMVLRRRARWSPLEG